MSLLIIGITGGTGGGKTTLLRELEARGALAVDCDRVYHELLGGSAEMLSEIEDEFPGAFIGGRLDRKALGKRVFGDEEALKTLNSITHRYVLREVDRRLREAEKDGIKLAAVDAIALIESGISEKCDVVVGVLADRERRIKRIMAREGITREYAEMRIDAQKRDEFFAMNCDYILRNDYETEDEFRIECGKLIDTIIEKSGKNECL